MNKTDASKWAGVALTLLLFSWTALAFLLFPSAARAQVEVRGTVYDKTMVTGLGEVNVSSASGAAAVTDSLGRYHIKLRLDDTLYFSYLGKRTPDFFVKDLPDPEHLDIAMGVVGESLPEVVVTANTYHFDSVENRREYQDIFNYQSPNYLDNAKMGRGRGIGVGLDLDMLIGGGARIDRSRLSTQRYMQEDERQRYIDHRFSKTVVKRLTGLQPPLLDTFMHTYRPTYEFLQSVATDWDLYEYIQEWGISFKEIWKDEHPNQDTTAATTPPSHPDTPSQ